MVLFDSIQSVKGFARKFPITEDIPKTNWATKTDVEAFGETAAQQLTETAAAITAAISNIQHSSLLGIGANDHHDKLHSDTHHADGSDPFTLPFEFKHGGSTKFKIDTSGNIYIAGKVLKI